jgi:hypothetical protein
MWVLEQENPLNDICGDENTYEFSIYIRYKYINIYKISNFE